MLFYKVIELWEDSALEKENIQYDLLHTTYQTIYDLVGEEGLMKFYHEFRGTQVSSPMKLYDNKKLGKYLGTLNGKSANAKKLSQDYGFSQRWIRKAISKGTDNK